MEESLGYYILSQFLGAQAVLVAISHVSYFSVNNFKGTAVKDFDPFCLQVHTDSLSLSRSFYYL